MSCDVAKFTITKGLDNTFVFTIKADGSTLPMEIVAGDTFSASLVNLEDNSVALSKSLTVTNALSGKVTLVITSSETSTLVSDKGTKTDRYYLRPTYKLVIDCNTTNNGDFIAKVPEVYVD
jgi:hypothetical protein